MINILEEPDGRNRLRLERASSVLVIQDAKNPIDVQGIPGRKILFIGPGADRIAERFTKWLAEQSVDDAAKALKGSTGLVGELRRHFGITGRL